MIKIFKKLMLVALLSTALISQSQAYLVVSILTFSDKLVPRYSEHDKKTCAMFFMFCLPYVVLSTEGNIGTAYALNFKALNSEAIRDWLLNDPNYSTKSEQILSDIEALKASEQVLVLESIDTKQTLAKGLVAINPQLAADGNITTAAFADLLGMNK